MRVRNWLIAAAAVALVLGCEEEETGEVTPTPESEEVAAAEGAAAAEEAPPAEDAEEEAGPVVSDPTFELRADAPGPYASGQLGQFAITLTPRGEFKVNEEYPMEIEIDASEDVGVAKSSLAKADAAEFGKGVARFDVPFTPSTSGEHTVRANVRFAVCTPENCVPDERTLALNVNVE